MNYYRAAVNAEEVGDLGTHTFEKMAIDLSNQSECYVTPAQLESLVYHTKHVIFEKVRPIYTDLKQRSYYKMMEHLSKEIPQMFKTLPSGEIVFINFEDRDHA